MFHFGVQPEINTAIYGLYISKTRCLRVVPRSSRARERDQVFPNYALGGINMCFGKINAEPQGNLMFC